MDLRKRQMERVGFYLLKTMSEKFRILCQLFLRDFSKIKNANYNGGPFYDTMDANFLVKSIGVVASCTVFENH